MAAGNGDQTQQRLRGGQTGLSNRWNALAKRKGEIVEY
jgi:hypothetical protein